MNAFSRVLGIRNKWILRLVGLVLPLVAFLVLATPAFAQAVTFQPKGPYATGTTNPVDIVRGDFDRDGDLDLATVSATCGTNACVTIFQNDGSGNYSTAPTTLALPVGVVPSSIDRGDFNGDSKPDIVVTDTSTTPGNVYVFLNTNATPGVISFGSPKVTSTGGNNPTDVAVGDFNGDGDADLAVTNQGSNTVSILISNGASGTFSLGQPPIPSPAGTSQPTAADAADFDNDGDLDVVIANQGTNNATLLQNIGGVFSIGQTVTVGTAPTDIIAADFNNNGNQDFATADSGSNDVAVALGNGNRTFQAAKTFGAQTNPTANITPELAHGDYNCDSNRDIAVTGPSNNNVQVLTGNGNGTFNGPAPFSVGTTPSGLTSGDFNGQTGPDLATSNYASNNISVLLNASPNCGGSNNSSFNLTKTDSPDPVTVGQNLTYALNLTNNGPNVSGVTITDTLPAGITFVSASSGCTNSSNTVTCNVGTLNNGGTATVQIVVQVNQAGTLTNSATAQSPSVPTPATATATTTAQSGGNNNGGNNNGGNNRNNNNNTNVNIQYSSPGTLQYQDTSDNGTSDDTGSTDTGTSSTPSTTAGQQYSTPGNDGSGTVADAGGTNPDTLPPESSPRGDVANDVPFNEPLPPTAGFSIPLLLLISGVWAGVGILSWRKLAKG